MKNHREMRMWRGPRNIWQFEGYQPYSGHKRRKLKNTEKARFSPTFKL